MHISIVQPSWVPFFQPRYQEKINQDVLMQVMEMGFSELRSEKALERWIHQGLSIFYGCCKPSIDGVVYSCQYKHEFGGASTLRLWECIFRRSWMVYLLVVQIPPSRVVVVSPKNMPSLLITSQFLKIFNTWGVTWCSYHMSSVQNPCWLMIIADYRIQNIGDI